MLDTPLPTLAEVFEQGGYDTFAGSNNSWISTGTRFSRGFRQFDKVWQLVQEGHDVLNQRMVGVFSKEGCGAKELANEVGLPSSARLREELLETVAGCVAADAEAGRCIAWPPALE